MKLEPAQPRGEITLGLLFDVARKRRALIAAVWLSTILGVAFVTFFILTPIYQSTAVVLVKLGREFVYNPEVGDRKAFLTSMDGIVLAELEILHSDDLLRDVVDTLDPNRLYPDLERDDVANPLQVAVRRFREKYAATAVSMTEVIRISFRHPDPEIAADAVNVLVDRLKEHHLRAFGEPQSTAFLQGKVVRFQRDLEESEKKLKEFQATRPILAVDNAAQMLEEERVRIDGALKRVRNEAAALKERGAFLKDEQASLSPYSHSDSLLEAALDLQIVSVVAEQRAQAMRQRGLQRQLAAATAELQTLPNHLSTYRALLRERDESARIYEIYSRWIEEALISEEMDRKKIANISVIQKGRPAIDPSSPNKLLNLAVGSILGLVLGFGLALRLEGLETEKEEVGVEVSEVLRLKPGLIREAEPNVWEWVPLKQSADRPDRSGD